MPDLRPAGPLTVLAMALGASPALAQRAEAWRTDFSIHTVPLEEILSGGPPKDGIPALDHPQFISVAEADAWLSDRDPVVLLGEAAEAKAYPLQILLWHEIVNDVVAGRPVAVTFCPLCNTALAFERRLDGVVLDFGTTGRLRHSDLVMYDRQTESWWQQATGEGIDRRLDGRLLSFDPLGDGRFRDRVTGSEFDLLGRAIAGLLRGARLQPVPHGNHFWFAWGVFKPSTRVVASPPES